jgi:hypothetical protein
MGLESGTFIADLNQSNPAGGDQESQGDDHLRLLKKVLQNSFPNSTRAKYIPTSVATQTSTVNLAATDDDKSVPVDATAGSIVVNLAAPAVDGIRHWIWKVDSGPNTVVVTPTGKTINGAATFALTQQYQGIVCQWCLALNNWLAFPIFNLSVLPYFTGGTDVAITDGGTGESTSWEGLDALIGLVASIVPSASTVDLTTTQGLFAQISGNTNISAITLNAGQMRIVRFNSDGGALVHSGTFFLPNRARNITWKANDWGLFLGLGSGVTECLFMQRANANPVGGSSLPTVQRFTSGSGTYNPTSGVTRIKVRMVAGGGGGGALSTNNGSNGNDSSFGSWTAIKGNGGNTGPVGTPGAGGTGGADGTGNLVVRIPGGRGGGGGWGSPGGGTPFGFSAAAGRNPTPGAAPANSGAGGAGAGDGSSGGNAAAGGGGGEYVEFWVDLPGSTSYVVGAGGNGGAAGGTAGAAGAAGIIIVEEFYN